MKKHWWIPLVVGLVASGLGMTPAQASSGWTWSTATHPAGSVNLGGASSGGGLYRYRGFYFIPGVGHVDNPLGQGMWERPNTAAGDVPGQGFLGHVAYTTNRGTSSPYEPDLGLIATGSRPIAPVVKVSHAWDRANVVHYATGNGDMPAGAWVCQSGFSTQTESHSGYRCGQLLSTCDSSAVVCQFSNPNGVVSGGDSGGLVWWYANGGITVLGWVSTGMYTPYAGGPYPLSADGSYTAGQFVPPWQMAHHQWAASESWSSGGFPAGNNGTGCFVTITGCQKM